MCMQANAQHLNFMGFQIDGTLEEFGNNLETKGFKKTTKNSLKGMFAGYNATITLSSAIGGFTKKDDIVANVTVKFNENQVGSIDIFHNLSKWLSVKYGAFDESYDYLLKSNKDNYKVSTNRVWCTEFGTIVLIDGFNIVGSKSIDLIYIDRQNTSGNKGEDIMNDL